MDFVKRLENLRLSSSDGDDTFEKLLLLIEGHARRDEIMASFRKEYLQDVLTDNPNASKALSRLLVCLETHKKLAEMEQLMDKKYFCELIESDFLITSGKNKEGRRIIWLRSGFYCKGMWNMKNRSPKSYALLRALLFGLQLGYAEAASSNEFVRPVTFIDECERGNLDFNLSIECAYCEYIDKLIPSKAFQGVVFGVGYAIVVIARQVKTILSIDGLLFKPETSFESVGPHVFDTDSIPQYIFDDEDDSNTFDRRNIPNMSPRAKAWKRRILGGGPPLTPADIFNPPATKDALETFEQSSKHEDNKYDLTPTALEAIEEDGEEDW